MADKTKSTKRTTKAEEKQSDARVTAEEQFDSAAKVGHEAAAENIKAEANDNKDAGEAGSENIQFEAKTSDAEPELKPEGDKMPKEDVLGDDKSAQTLEGAVKKGQGFAKENLADSDEVNPDDSDSSSLQDVVEEGRKTAKENVSAERARAKKAGSTR